jgi:hypothetical protein
MSTCSYSLIFPLVRCHNSIRALINMMERDLRARSEMRARRLRTTPIGFLPFLADPNRTLPIANLAGGISRACGKAKDRRSAGIGDEESAIRICEPWLRQRDENTRPSNNLFQDGTLTVVGCWALVVEP